MDAYLDCPDSAEFQSPPPWRQVFFLAEQQEGEPLHSTGSIEVSVESNALHLLDGGVDKKAPRLRGSPDEELLQTAARLIDSDDTRMDA
jgi:hypothetical protein